MKPLPSWARILVAVSSFTGVHWMVGRWRRALAWDAAALAAVLLLPFASRALLLLALVGAAELVDALRVAPARERSGARYVGLFLLVLLTEVTAAKLVRHFFIEAFRTPSGSMIPTLAVGDHFWVAKWQRTPRRGDIVVFDYPQDRSKTFVKRVLAVGGDTIGFGRDGTVVLNGQPLPHQPQPGPCSYEDYDEALDRVTANRCQAVDETLDGRTYRIYFDGDGTRAPELPAQRVPPGSYFVAGDNRDNSNDSRRFGAVAQPLVNGRAIRIWAPLAHAGELR